MSYIDKNSTVVVSARMTNKGRELLSLGLLTFDTFRLGDSEIDYKTLGSSYDITLENIIRAKAENPNLKTPLLPVVNATNTYLSVPVLNPVILETFITAPNIGFFDYNITGTPVTYTAYTDSVCHGVIQADTMIPVSGLTGGNIVSVKKASTYGTNTASPKIGDLMLIKMNNDKLTTTQNKGIVELNNPVPYLWYQIQSLSGTVASNTLKVEVDRNLPNFSSYSGPNYCWASFYHLGTGATKDTLFSTNGYLSGGCVWNMNNVWSYPIPGVNPATYENFDQYGSESYVGSKEYFGYTSEPGISGSTFDPFLACNLVPAISIIHYTNDQTCTNQTELRYGQKFYVDTTIAESPKLILPTLMWHRSVPCSVASGTTGMTIGYIFSGSGFTQYVTLSGTNTTIAYTPLVDNGGYQVGRIYPQLQMFTLDDQELVTALSYKSNRNWTLPTLEADTTVSTGGIITGTDVLYLTYLLVSNSGYTTGLHCQNVTCVTPSTDCPPTFAQNVNVQFPSCQFPYMTSGTTGWYADTFYILAQRKQIGLYPDPAQWTLMDYTATISNHTVGNRIDPNNLQASTFILTDAIYSGGTNLNYDLNNFITIPTKSQPDYLQFGDERFFFGNVEATGVTDKYRTKFDFVVPPTFFNWSVNPTWTNNDGSTNGYVHISEIGVYDVNKNLVAIGKLNLPIEKVPNVTIIVEIAFDL